MAGAQQNGMLSRQQGEPMATYLVRRQAWYETMVPKTRTVYFAVQGQHQDDDDHCYMAQRYNAVPPPSSLQDGFVTLQLTPVTTPAPTPDRRHMDDQLVPVTQVSEGAVLTQDELDNFMLVSALGVSETRDDGRVIYEVPEELSGYGLPAGLSGGGLQEFLHGLPRLPEPLGLPDLIGQMAQTPAPELAQDLP